MLVWVVSWSVFACGNFVNFHDANRFLKEQGVDQKRFHVEDFGQVKGLGLVADELIEKGKPIFEIELENAWCSGDDYPWKKFFYKEHHKLQLMVRILYDIYVNPTQNTFKLRYWDILPPIVKIPEVWDKDTKQWLIMNSLSLDTSELEITIYDSLQKVGNQFAKGDFSEWLNYSSWGKVYTIVMSRALPINLSEYKQAVGKENLDKSDINQTGYCLVPILDIINHKSNSNQPAQIKIANGKLTVYAEKDFQPNEEVTITYNAYTNIQFVLNYGFVPTKNPNDEFSVIFQSQICNEYPYADKACKWVLNQHSINPRLLDFLKVFPKQTEDTLMQMLRYRYLINQEISEGKQPLRTLRRTIPDIMVPDYKLGMEYGVTQRELLFRQRAIIDKALLKHYLKELNLQQQSNNLPNQSVTQQIKIHIKTRNANSAPNNLKNSKSQQNPNIPNTNCHPFTKMITQVSNT